MTEAERALDFHKIAREVFAPIYPVLASQILGWFQRQTGRPLVRGNCLDVGSAAGHLGVALARQTYLEVTLADISAEALALSEDLVGNDPVSQRIHKVVADVQELPFEDAAFDLIVSRGSLWFWSDKDRAFRELWRVMRPGGMAFIGGGFGTAGLRDSINQIMGAREGERWLAGQKQRREGNSPADLSLNLERLALPYQLIDNDSGLWVLIPKPLAKNGFRRKG